MEIEEIKQIIQSGEDSCHQFKENIHNAKSLAAEMVAFSNSHGGEIFIGINDSGEVIGLSNEDIRRVNQLISNAASENVKSAINPHTQNISINGKIIIILAIHEGVAKPYMDSEGLIWVKNGADKRKVTSREELRRLFQESDLIYADETPVKDTTVDDIDRVYFAEFYQRVYKEDISQSIHSFKKIFENLNLAINENLNLAGLLLFGKNPQFKKPVLIVKAVSFVGNSVTTTQYRDSEDIDGNLMTVYKKTISFLTRNLHKIQNGQSVNSAGELELPIIALEELVVNMLIHRDYFISSTCKVFIFDNRIELISPGHLPNKLTIEHIKKGNSIIRNPVIASFAAKELPYRGLGTGIMRALDHYPHIDFVNDVDNNLFRCIIHRPVQP